MLRSSEISIQAIPSDALNARPRYAKTRCLSLLLSLQITSRGQILQDVLIRFSFPLQVEQAFLSSLSRRRENLQDLPLGFLRESVRGAILLW